MKGFILNLETSKGSARRKPSFGRSGPEPEAALMENTGACAAWEDGHEWRALRSKRYTHAIYRKDGQELLFDNVTEATLKPESPSLP